MGHKDFRLGQLVYILGFYNISFSWFFHWNGFQFISLLRDSENDLLILIMIMIMMMIMVIIIYEMVILIGVSIRIKSIWRDLTTVLRVYTNRGLECFFFLLRLFFFSHSDE